MPIHGPPGNPHGQQQPGPENVMRGLKRDPKKKLEPKRPPIRGGGAGLEGILANMGGHD